MARKTVFPDAGSRMEDLIAHLEQTYRSRQFEVQVLEIDDRATRGKLLQLRQVSPQTWLEAAKNVSGLGTAATVKAVAHGPALEIEVFGGKWLDKVAVGAVSLVVLWPLLVTAGIGAWRQNALLDEVYKEVSQFLAGHAVPAAMPGPSFAPAPASHCASCGTPFTASMKFCGGCGTRLSAAPAVAAS